MSRENNTNAPEILTVTRTKDEARRSYDRISRYYDCVSGIFERKYTGMALERLAVREGETVLEIGFGTGYCLKKIAESVGPEGKVCGIDLSAGMMAVAKKRLFKAGLMDRVELHTGDAADLPFDDGTFNAAFMSFVLELFDTPEIPKVLRQIKRVLKPEGRLGVVSMSKEYGETIFMRLYERAHVKWPGLVDCRPIYLERALREAGYTIKSQAKVKLSGLPGKIVIALK
jgi:ubiquinone/menaquinone biosynthesis C-methylase UbiE